MNYARTFDCGACSHSEVNRPLMNFWKKRDAQMDPNIRNMDEYGFDE
jgi:hypothetical protein